MTAFPVAYVYLSAWRKTSHWRMVSHSSITIARVAWPVSNTARKRQSTSRTRNAVGTSIYRSGTKQSAPTIQRIPDMILLIPYLFNKNPIPGLTIVIRLCKLYEPNHHRGDHHYFWWPDHPNLYSWSGADKSWHT